MPKARRLLTLAAIAAATSLTLATAATPAMAESKTVTLYSTDRGAKSKTTINWKSAKSFSTSSEQCDLKSDSNGPVLEIVFYYTIATGPGANRVVVNDHLTKGKTWCDYPTSSTAFGSAIDYVEINQCNGIEWWGNDHCDYIKLTNPYA